MRKTGFWLTYLLLWVAQVLLSNFFNITPYIVLTILPAMVLCIPTRMSPAVVMIIAFLSGISVDLLSDGLIGLNAFALVPVALARNIIIRLVWGGELFSRKEDFSFRKSGIEKVAVAVIIAQALFLLLYIWADGAGTRPFWFNTARFAASTLSSSVVSMFAVRSLAQDNRR